MKTWWIGSIACSALLLTSVAAAQQSKVYASMVVTGSIGINPDGSVSGYVLDKSEKLPQGVQTALIRNIPRWKFEPVLRDGKPVKAKSYMSVRLVAAPTEHGGYNIHVSGAHFGLGQTDKGKQGTKITYAHDHRDPPDYPRKALRHHVMGAVYLLVQVGRDGKVQHVAAEQVDLFAKGSSRMMKHGRKALAQASVNWAKHLTFAVPTKGPEANNNHWIVRIPLVYRLTGNGNLMGRRGRQSSKPGYGQWQPYMPGPKQYIPWLGEHVAAQGSADAIPADGGLYPLKQSLHLLTPLGSGS